MSSWKTEQELARDGLPQLLRDLAQALETGLGAGLADGPSGGPSGGPSDSPSDGLFGGLPVRQLRKLVLVAERHDSGLTLKIKAKRSGELRVPARRQAGGKPTPRGGPQDPPAEMRQDGRTDAPRDRSDFQAAREKYRQLKKTLQADFKAVQAAASEGRLPDAETLESFLSLSELMAQGEQPVRGPVQAEMVQANATFMEDCQALRRAWSARDAAALGAVLERLARRKSACHAQFR